MRTDIYVKQKDLESNFAGNLDMSSKELGSTKKILRVRSHGKI
jgi:hypothetical protein